MGDNEPIARRTRAQTAAIRAASAGQPAAQRAASDIALAQRRSNNEIADLQRRLEQINLRAIGPHDVQAHYARAAIEARMARIINRLNDEVQILRRRNAVTVARSTGSLTARRTRIVNVRRVMDENISSLYNLSQDMYEYLNVDQMLYFSRNSLTDNYYFRKLELAYGIPVIDKFNQICQNIIDNIPVSSNIDTLPYRYDIDYYCQIVNFLEEIIAQFILVSNKDAIKLTLITELTNSINNEKTTIANLISHLNNVKDQIDRTQIQSVVITSIERTIAKLHQRKFDLNGITSQTINAHFDDKEEFENIRKYTLLILQAAITLCKIFLILIIKLYNNKDIEDINARATAYADVITHMYEAIANFTYIINTPSIDTNDLILLVTMQTTLYTAILDTLSPGTLRQRQNIINAYNNQDISMYRIQYRSATSRTGSLHPLTYEITSPPEDVNAILRRQTRPPTSRRDFNVGIRTLTTNLRQDAINAGREARRERNAAREAAIAARRDARIAAAAAAAAARASGRAARAARAARPARPVIVPGPAAARVPGTAALTNIPDMFDIDPNAADRYTRTYIVPADDEFKTPTSLLNKLKDKYVLYSKDFKTVYDKQLLFADFKTRFNSSFNTDEPVPRVDSIDNYVGNSIASLFARAANNGGDMKFNDLGKYYVINYTLELNDDPATADRKKYRKIRQAGIDAGGLRRDFITALTSELFEKKIFITRDETKKYYLNPLYVPDEEFQFIVKENTEINVLEDADFIKKFYKFIGLLLSFILVNDCGIEHNLSSYILALFNNSSIDDLDDYDYVYFMLNDFTIFTTSILNLMADPPTIQHTFIGFNDYYQLVPEDKDLDRTNIQEYLILLSKFMMTKTILRKEIDIPQGTSEDDITSLIHKSNKMHKYLGKGIPDVIKSYFSKLTLKSINSYLVTPTMSDDIINKLIRNFTTTMNKKIRLLPPNSNLQKLTELFINYVLTNPIANPTEQQKEVFFKFIDKLLKFWSGSSFYKANEEYKIQINAGLSATHLPQSHTCFFLIDLPDYIQPGKSDDEIGKLLYDKINTAILNVEDGISLHGGAKKKAKRNKK